MQLKNSAKKYGFLSIGFHWICAVLIFGLFGVGLWMVELDYYDSWYQTAPHWHKSFGVLLVFIMCLRLISRVLQPKVEKLSNHSRLEVFSAKFVHVLFYLLVVLMLPTGYLLATGSGQGMAVFNWLSLPAMELSTLTELSTLIFADQNLEDIALKIHEIFAYSIIALAFVHVIGALKHHFFDKDRTLKRIFGL